MRIRADEKGQMLVLTALSLVVILGFMAVAVDVGVLYRAKRNMQIAADAAAVAGAQDYLFNASTTSATAAAAAAAAANGVSTSYTVAVNTACPDTTQNCVVVNIPATGSTSGVTGAVEAIVATPNPTFFMRVLGAGNVTVAARAVAGTPTTGLACIWAMAPTGMGMKLQGSYGIDSPGCGVYVNSTSSNAIDVIGNGGTVNALFVDVVGGNSGNHVTSPTGETLNAGPRQTPWGNLTGPTPSAKCSSLTTTTGNSIASSTVTQAQINTAQAAALAGNGVVCLTATNATITATNLWGSASGITYLFSGTGNVTIGNSMTFGGDPSGGGAGIPSFTPTPPTFQGATEGATLDIYQGTFQQSNQALTMYAPTSNSQGMSGISLFQPPSNTNELQCQFGSGSEVMDGYIYAPGAEVFMQDSGGSITATGIVASYIYEKTTNLTIANSYDSANAGTSLNRVVTLVE